MHPWTHPRNHYPSAPGRRVCRDDIRTYWITRRRNTQTLWLQLRGIIFRYSDHRGGKKFSQAVPQYPKNNKKKKNRWTGRFLDLALHQQPTRSPDLAMPTRDYYRWSYMMRKTKSGPVHQHSMGESRDRITTSSERICSEARRPGRAIIRPSNSRCLSHSIRYKRTLLIIFQYIYRIFTETMHYMSLKSGKDFFRMIAILL